MSGGERFAVYEGGASWFGRGGPGRARRGCRASMLGRPPRAAVVLWCGRRGGGQVRITRADLQAVIAHPCAMAAVARVEIVPLPGRAV